MALGADACIALRCARHIDWKHDVLEMKFGALGVLVVAVTVIAFAAAIVIGNRTPKPRPIRNHESEVDRKAA